MRHDNIGTRIGLACGAIAFGLVMGLGGCDDPPPQRNRVVTVPAQIEQAQQAAKDAQASADRAEATKKDIYDAINKLNSNGRNSDGTWKVGQAQVSGIGTVTEVGEIKNSNGTSDTYIFWFTFAERAGFVKKFLPVCPNQEIPVNSTVILNFHWKEYESQIPGCYMIDGHTVVK